MNKCKLHYFRSVGKFFVFFEHEIVKRSSNVALAYNVERLAVRCGLDNTNFQLKTKVYE